MNILEKFNFKKNKEEKNPENNEAAENLVKWREELNKKYPKPEGVSPKPKLAEEDITIAAENLKKQMAEEEERTGRSAA